MLQKVPGAAGETGETLSLTWLSSALVYRFSRINSDHFDKSCLDVPE